MRRLNVKTVLFKVIGVSITTPFSSFWSIDRSLSGITTLGQSESASEGGEGVLRIPPNPSVTGTSRLDYLVSKTTLAGASLTPLLRSSRQSQPTRPQETRWGVCPLRKVAVGVFCGPSLSNSSRNQLKSRSSGVLAELRNWKFKEDIIHSKH